jgi:hypothetical protein
VRDCAVDLSLVCVALPSLTYVLLLWSSLYGQEAPSCGDSSQTGERLRKEKPWYSSWSSDHLKGVECNPRPLGCHNVEVGKYYLAEPWDKNHVSCVLSLWLFCPQELASQLLSRTNISITKFCGYLVLNFTGSPIQPPLGALKVLLRKCYGHMRPFRLDEGSLYSDILYHSLWFLLLFLVGWFETWTACDRKHELRRWRWRSLMTLRSHCHSCGSGFQPHGGCQCWSLVFDCCEP